jgi:hypothetical protein
MKALLSSETSGNIHPVTQGHISEGLNLQQRRCENLKSCSHSTRQELTSSMESHDLSQCSQNPPLDTILSVIHHSVHRTRHYSLSWAWFITLFTEPATGHYPERDSSQCSQNQPLDTILSVIHHSDHYNPPLVIILSVIHDSVHRTRHWSLFWAWFITVFTITRHWSLSWTWWTQSTLSLRVINSLATSLTPYKQFLLQFCMHFPSLPSTLAQFKSSSLKRRPALSSGTWLTRELQISSRLLALWERPTGIIMIYCRSC